MICLKCNTFHTGFAGRLCPVCSEPLQIETTTNRDKLVLGRLREYLSLWQKNGIVSKKSVVEIENAIFKTNLLSEDKQESLSLGFVSLFLDWFQNLISAFFIGIGHLFEPIIQKPSSTRYRVKRSGKEIDASYENLTEGMLASDDSASNSRLSGLDSITELDEKVYRKTHKNNELEIWAGLRPLFNEYIWWFIGSLLVLTGSIMGIREAWLVLSGISRHITVLSAIYLYEVLFTALGIFLGSRSILTGRLLSGISLLLLPVSFSVVSDVLLADSIIGLFVLAILVALTYGILIVISRQFQIEANRFILPILPALVLQSLIPFLGTNLFTIILCFIPFFAVNQMGQNMVENKSGSQGLFIYSIYGALAVLVVFLNQSLAGNSIFALGTISFGVFLLWLLGLSSIFVLIFGMLSIRSEVKKIYIVLEILFLAVTLVIASASGLYIYLNSTNVFYLDGTRFLYLIMPVLVTFLFFDAMMRQEAAIHPFMFLSIFSSFLVTREFLPLTNWQFAFASIAPVSGLLFQKNQSIKMQRSLIVWGITSGILSCLILMNQDLFLTPNASSLSFDSIQRFFTITPMLASGLYFGILTHKVGGWNRSLLHLPAAFGTFTVIQALSLFFLPVANGISRLGVALGILCIVYNFGAIEFERKLENKKEIDQFQPMDDISLLAGILSLFGILFVSSSGYTENVFFMIAGFILIMRSFRDRSSFSSFIGSLLISIAVFRLLLLYFVLPGTAMNAFISSIIAIGTGLLCILFPNINPVSVSARKVFFVIRLPFPAQCPVLIRNALSATSLLFITYSVSLLFIWFGLFGQPERNYAIYSGVILAFVFLVSFFTRAFHSFYLRGSTVALALIFLCIGLAAVANRIGRPLPPTVVGFNLSLGIIGLWIFSRILFYKGQILANWLDNPNQGKFYHFVPLSVMLLLGIVLLIDALLLQPYSISRFLYITPPTFFVGAGIATLLFGVSINKLIPLNFAFGLFVLASALGFAQESFMGTKLIALDPPGGRWVPAITEFTTRTNDWLNPQYFLPPDFNLTKLIIRSAAGIAFAGTVYALFVLLLSYMVISSKLAKLVTKWKGIVPIQSSFYSWTFITTGILTCIAIKYAFVTPGIIALIGGVFLLLSGFSREGLISIALNGLLIIHGIAHQNPFYPIWVGPVFAGIAFIMVLSVKPLSLVTKKPFSGILENSHMGAFIYTGTGFIYALAALSVAVEDNAVSGLLVGVGFGLGGLWMQTLAVGITSGISALSLTLGAFQWTKILSTLSAAFSIIMLGIAGITSFPFLCQFGICVQNPTPQLLPEMFPYFGFILSIIATVAFFLSRITKENREDYSIGVSYGSDILIIMIGILLGVFARLATPSSLSYSSIAFVISVGIVIVISLLASYKQRKPRHLYFAQTSIASLYLTLKLIFPESLTPEIDALAALIFGFILTGITTVARRAGIPPLEESTRRFAALMPVVAVIVLPSQASYENAGMATFSAALYAALAVASSNRIYAVLAAIAANFAIYTAIMASNVQGIEIFLAPVGLFTLFLGHIFRENLTDAARKIIRISGGLLLYLPAAVNISFEMGRATDAMYAVLFGLVCLAGVAAGMIFQIRSYLFMGVSFFTLNLVANLLQKGLRDQRMGFVLLSITGLFIIGSLVYYTLKKEQILGFVGKLQKNLAKWD